jgi:hypothetical protein
MVDTKIEIYAKKNEKGNNEPFVLKDNIASERKINQLIKSSIDRFEEFLNTMRVLPDKMQLPEKYDEHNVRSALLAKFYIGRLYSKIITQDPGQKITYLNNCIDNYKYIVNYCDKEKLNNNLIPLDLMKVEYDICKEMNIYLPFKLEKFRKML